MLIFALTAQGAGPLQGPSEAHRLAAMLGHFDVIARCDKRGDSAMLAIAEAVYKVFSAYKYYCNLYVRGRYGKN